MPDLEYEIFAVLNVHGSIFSTFSFLFYFKKHHPKAVNSKF